MRTKNLFRSIVAATLAVVSMSAFAQFQTSTSSAPNVDKGTPHAYTTPSATVPQVVDFVTVRSVMPYTVTPDPTIKTIVASGAPFQPSSYNWRLCTTPKGTMYRADSTTALANIPGDPAGYNTGFYLDTAITVKWTTVGIDSIKVSEHSRNSGGLQTCNGADTTLYVYVMPRPTAAFNEAMCGIVAAADIQGTIADGIIGGCGVAGLTIHFAVDVTGTQDFIVNGRYQYTPFGGAAGAWTSTTVGAATFANDSLVASGKKNGTSGTFDGLPTHFYSATPTSVQSTTIDAFQFTVPATTYGKYVFQLYKVTDLVSRKSFKDTDANAANGYDNVANRGDLTAGVQTLTLYSLPQPTTGRVQHVTNAGW